MDRTLRIMLVDCFYNHLSTDSYILPNLIFIASNCIRKIPSTPKLPVSTLWEVISFMVGFLQLRPIFLQLSPVFLQLQHIFLQLRLAFLQLRHAFLQLRTPEEPAGLFKCIIIKKPSRINIREDFILLNHNNLSCMYDLLISI